jgi:peptide/nickel transport system permease protein
MRTLLRRLLWVLLVVWATTTLTFFVTAVLPGDPARLVAGPSAGPAQIEAIRRELGLDRPPLFRYGLFLRRLVHTRGHASHQSCQPLVWGVHVDLGQSVRFRQPVLGLVASRLPRTLLLAFAAVCLQLAFGIPLGALAAARRGTWLDTGAVGATLLGASVPTFLLGPLLQFLFAYELQLLPLDGYGTTPLEHAACLVLPALTLGIVGSAGFTRLARSELMTVLAQDHVRTARAKGLGEVAVVFRHGVRVALGPLVTAAGLELGGLVGGAMVTESVFRWPGLGQLSVQAALGRDSPLLSGIVLVSSATIALLTLLVDLSYRWLDPRQR